MPGNNVKITIESEEHYWNKLIIGLDTLLVLQHRQKIPSEIISAVSHFKVKLDRALISGLAPEIVESAEQLTKEDMTAAYHDSFTA